MLQTYGKGRLFVLFAFWRRGFFQCYHELLKVHKNSVITQTMTKILMYVRYLEKEYGYEMLNRTKRKYSQSYNRVC